MNIQQEIIEFIGTEENNGALLITGSWGCGKSYLVKALVDDFNQGNEYAIAVISLFGIDSVAMLHERIKDAYLEFNSGLLGKSARKIFSALQKVANESAKVTAVALPASVTAAAISTGISSVTSFDALKFVSVKNTVGLGEKRRKFAIVLDDFERCGIDRKQLLGVINEYSENRLIKTILIADEEKIIQDGYKEFKEKLISRTLKMVPDHTDTIHSIIVSYKDKDTDYKEFIKKNEHCFRGAYLHSGYNNLRTLKACVFDFKRVYIAWKKSNIPMDDIENILYKFCAIMFETKAGIYGKVSLAGYRIHLSGTNGEKEEQRRTILDKYLPETFDYVLSSISSWIVDGDWNEDDFIQEIKRRYVKESLTHEQKFLNYHFWDLQQEDINEGMPVVVKRACEGALSRDELISLLQKIHALKANHIQLPCVVDYIQIEKAFDERKQKIKNGLIDEPKRRTFSEHSQLDSEAITLYKKIENMDEQLVAWENRKLFVKFLNNEGRVTQYELKNRYIDCFDDELYDLFIATYNNSLNGDKRELCLVLKEINFNNSLYSSQDETKITIKNFKLLVQELDNQIEANTDQMAVAIAKAFKGLLEEKISSFGSSK